MVSPPALDSHDCCVGNRCEGCSTHDTLPSDAFVWLKHCGFAAQAAAVVTLEQISAQDDVCVFQLQSGLLRH